MRVYRIQHKSNGLGPYREYGCPILDNLAGNLREAHRSKETHPTPKNEGICTYGDYGNEDMRCAFESLQKLYSWFGDWINKLNENNFVLAEYDAEDVRVGKKQVVFFLDKATLIKTSKLTTYEYI